MKNRKQRYLKRLFNKADKILEKDEMALVAMVANTGSIKRAGAKTGRAVSGVLRDYMDAERKLVKALKHTKNVKGGYLDLFKNSIAHKVEENIVNIQLLEDQGGNLGVKCIDCGFVHWKANQRPHRAFQCASCDLMAEHGIFDHYKNLDTNFMEDFDVESKPNSTRTRNTK